LSKIGDGAVNEVFGIEQHGKHRRKSVDCTYVQYTIRAMDSRNCDYWQSENAYVGAGLSSDSQARRYYAA
jgi:hypothetical protein